MFSTGNCVNFLIDVLEELVILFEDVYEIYGNIRAASNSFKIKAYQQGTLNLELLWIMRSRNVLSDESLWLSVDGTLIYQQQHFICTWIYNSFYHNIFKIPKIKWRPPVVTMRASWEQVACIEEELQRLLVRIRKNSISGYIKTKVSSPWNSFTCPGGWKAELAYAEKKVTHLFKSR